MSTPRSGSQPTSFDARPLTEPVDSKNVKAFIRETGATRDAAILTTVFLIVALAVVAFVVIPQLVIAIASSQPTRSPLSLIVPLGVAAFIVIGIVLAVRSFRRGRVARYRIAQFAAANNLTYIDRITDPPLPGMIFHRGSSRRSDRVVRGELPRFVEFGNYQYTVKSGKSSTTYNWGYVAVKLDVPLPNIVLDAIGNNGFGSNLPASFGKDQRLSLEGDFDQYFTLYCPEGYERDALYLFTPDIMTRFTDNAAQLDVEIVDDWLFLYSKRPLSTPDPATWAWLFGAVGALMTKFDQWARWRDDRLQTTSVPVPAEPGGHTLPFAAPTGMLTPPPGVADQGRRLKSGVKWVPILLIVASFIAWNLFRMLLPN